LKARLKTGKRIIDLQKQLQEQAKQDVLTGLCNRKGMYNLLEKEINRSLRDNRPFSILMADIDKFKSINDKYGHHIGDVVLQETAKVLKKRVRKYDEVCRYGGDEFLAILPNCNSANALSIAERLRQIIGSHKITSDGKSLSIAFSLGGVSSENFGKGVTAESLIRKADEALLQAKNRGRNRVVINKKME
jgi:diguanylate cyclase (GGDEF)-like protein